MNYIPHPMGLLNVARNDGYKFIFINLGACARKLKIYLRRVVIYVKIHAYHRRTVTKGWRLEPFD